MSQKHETATDRLVSIIQLIQLGKLTGKLTARRGDGLIQEEGFILFRKGQVIQAVVAQRHGSDAFNMLTTWGNCSFLFLPSEGVDDAVTQGPTTAPLPYSTNNRDSGPLDQPVTDRMTPFPDTSFAYTNAPYRSRSLDSALGMLTNLGLSRAHRQLLLLIDGQRPIPELIRLTGKSAREVEQLLRELERANLVQLP